MNPKNVFAVDFGASGGKCFAGLFDEDTFELREVHRFAHEATPFYIADKSGAVTERTYWDDTLLYDNLLQGLQNYRRDVADTVDSIGIDTWGSDGHFFTEDGDILGKVYCYRDHRLDSMVDTVKSRVGERIYEITGIHFQPFNISGQLHWFVTNRRNLLLPGCFFLPIPSLFYYYLGGVRMVDSTWASVTQLMDAKKKQWSDEILNKLDIPRAVLPEIVEPGTVVGQLLQPIADRMGLNRPKLISVGSHDTASAFAAAPVENTDDSLIISSGTWCLVGKLIPEPITNKEAMAVNMSNEGGIGNIRFLKNCMGLWLVQELRRGWRDSDGREMDWDEMINLTQKASAFTGFIDPDDPGFYNPSNMQDAIAEFLKKTEQPVPGERGAFLRIVYESLALKYRVINEQICAITGTSSKILNIVGGGSKNELLNQFAANACGMPVLAGPEEATAVGNAMVQAMGLGIIDTMSDAIPIIKNSFPIKEYVPQDTDKWSKAYETFKKVTKAG